MRVAKYYNKKVKVKQFAEGDLVWKALLPIGTKVIRLFCETDQTSFA
jgi:hypothetical protein